MGSTSARDWFRCWSHAPPPERRALLASADPVCGGKEVWLLAVLGSVSFAIRGFTLPFALVLWLLIVHGVSIQLRSHSSSPSWPVRAGSLAGLSVLMALFCGASFSKALRGALTLDWYSCLVGSIALFALTMHGALWVAMKSASPVRERAALLAHRMWWLVAAVTIAGSAATLAIQPALGESIRLRPACVCVSGNCTGGTVGNPCLQGPSG